MCFSIGGARSFLPAVFLLSRIYHMSHTVWRYFYAGKSANHDD